MNELWRLLSVTLIAAMLLVSHPAVAAPGAPAFPGAEGFGANTMGGRGGKVYEVTNINNSGVGSLRNCVQASGPRVCIFRTGGLIRLQSPLVIRNPYITIAGQTAPGGGITIRTASGGNVFETQTSQVIMRYLSVRPGPGGNNYGDQIGSDGIELTGIMLDHMTYSWATSVDLETWYRVVGMTIQWSIISEALNCSTNSKGCHSKGLLIGGYAGSERKNSRGSENVSVLHNLMAHNGERTPLMQMCGTAQVVNNVTYNPEWTFAHQQDDCYVPAGGVPYINRINWIGNYHKKGPSSTSDTDLKVIPAESGIYSGGAQVYVQGNIGPSRPSDAQPDSDWVDPGSQQFVVGTPAEAPIVSATDAQTAYTRVLNQAGNSMGLDCSGNWYPRRDAIDARVVNDVRNGTGRIINSPAQVGGWITPAAGVRCADSDHDGMPDVWEVRYGLNPSEPADSSSDLDGDGYTNLEEYLNGTDPTSAMNAQSVVMYSNGAQDGWILESAAGNAIGGTLNQGGLTLLLGDNAARKQYRSILSFDTSILPANAAIVSATLKIKKAGQVGADPFLSLGDILVDIRTGAFGDDARLRPSDFQAASSRDAVLTLSNTPTGGWYSAALDPSNLGLLNLDGLTQFRLRFATPSNNNLLANYMKFYSGNYTTARSYRPTLIITYLLP